MATLVHVYHYPACGTCKKALAWLDRRGVRYAKTDLVAHPIPRAKLEDLHRRAELPLRRFFNASGESYRAGNFKDRLPTMSDAAAFIALAADGKLVKRPIVDAGKMVLVGFDEAAFAAAFG